MTEYEVAGVAAFDGRVYAAQSSELFFKALAHRVANRHPDESISVVIEGQSYGLTSSSTYIR